MEPNNKQILAMEYVHRNYFYNCPIQERLAIDMGTRTVPLISTSEELLNLSEEELRDKIASLEKPEWNDWYEKYIRNNVKSDVKLYITLSEKVKSYYTEDDIYEIIKEYYNID